MAFCFGVLFGGTFIIPSRRPIFSQWQAEFQIIRRQGAIGIAPEDFLASPGGGPGRFVEANLGRLVRGRRWRVLFDPGRLRVSPKAAT
ncbi:hypothetical protein FAIPA1_430032 [Frankia sp. AiPs1]